MAASVAAHWVTVLGFVLTCIKCSWSLILDHALEGGEGSTILVAPGGHQACAQHIKGEADQGSGDTCCAWKGQATLACEDTQLYIR
jgi:hypothetical protein